MPKLKDLLQKYIGWVGIILVLIAITTNHFYYQPTMDSYFLETGVAASAITPNLVLICGLILAIINSWFKKNYIIAGLILLATISIIFGLFVMGKVVL